MTGTISGGKLAAKTNKERYGEDFYKVQGAKGGSVKGTQGGFASPKLCTCEIFDYQAHTHNRCAGARGGKISSRRGVKNTKEKQS